jgi:hypothetical protein
MRYHFEQCLERGKIVKIEIASDIILKEINEAKNDLDSCERSMQERNFKMGDNPGLLFYVSF